MRSLVLVTLAAALVAPPAHARTRSGPQVIRPGQRVTGRLPAGPRVLVIGSTESSSFGGLRAGVLLGRAIARGKGTVVTGGARGVPYAAVRGAHRVGGQTLNVAPWSSMARLRKAGDPLRGFTHVWLTRVPRDLQRLGISEGSFNHWMHRQTHDVVAADAVVVTPGHGGTIGELGNALVLKRPVAVLELPGKHNARFNAAMRALVEFHQATKSNPPIRFFTRPEAAAAWALRQGRK